MRKQRANPAFSPEDIRAVASARRVHASTRELRDSLVTEVSKCEDAMDELSDSFQTRWTRCSALWENPNIGIIDSLLAIVGGAGYMRELFPCGVSGAWSNPSRDLDMMIAPDQRDFFLSAMAWDLTSFMDTISRKCGENFSLLDYNDIDPPDVGWKEYAVSCGTGLFVKAFPVAHSLYRQGASDLRYDFDRSLVKAILENAQTSYRRTSAIGPWTDLNKCWDIFRSSPRGWER